MQKLTHQEIITQRSQNKNQDRLPVCLLLDNIRSLYNVGSLFRLADGARLERVILTGITGMPPHPGIKKTALGSEQSVPWEYHTDGMRIARRLAESGYQVVALEQVEGGKVYWEVDYQFPLCLVVGNEITGVRPELVEISDLAVEIPMNGEKNSLNAAMAAAIVTYEVTRQLKCKP